MGLGFDRKMGVCSGLEIAGEMGEGGGSTEKVGARRRCGLDGSTEMAARRLDGGGGSMVFGGFL